MKGHSKVIEILNDLLTNELTSVNQYFVHAKMCANWGYKRLASKVRAESIDEMKHADQLISRILYLDGVPNLQRLNKINVGQTVNEQLRLDLDLEKGAIQFLQTAIETVRSLGDYGTFELMTDILVSEEEHADWLETQLALVDQVGLENYLSQQIHDS
ncbi:MAG TPA: bacterioferritin [Kofleriaceae bacterium]|nr:bacterioferritin [Kofleriaceae bacterium]